MYSVANDAYLRMTPRGWLWTEWETISVTVIIIMPLLLLRTYWPYHAYIIGMVCVPVPLSLDLSSSATIQDPSVHNQTALTQMSPEAHDPFGNPLLPGPGRPQA